MFVALIIGFVTGWVISMPIGPVNAAAISRTLRYGYRHGIATGIGAALMDLLYCGGAAQIHEFLLASPIINLIFQFVGFAVLIILGIKTLRTQEEVAPEATEQEAREAQASAEARVKRLHVDPRGYLTPFLMGVVLYASNVAAIPEWIFISALWRSYGLLEEGVAINAMFALGAGFGTAGWFITLVRYIGKRQRGFKRSTLRTIGRVAAYALLLFGAYFGYQIVFATNWTAVQASWARM